MLSYVPGRWGGGFCPSPPSLRSRKVSDGFSKQKRHMLSEYMNSQVAMRKFASRSPITSQVRSKSKCSEFVISRMPAFYRWQTHKQPMNQHDLTIHHSNPSFWAFNDLGSVHWNTPKRSHFWPMERLKDVIFKDIDLKFGTHTNQDVRSSIRIFFLTFWKTFENIFKKNKFWFKKQFIFVKISKIRDSSF